MGLFAKKNCDICNEKIGLLGNRKLEDGNMCKNCAAFLSPFLTDRRRTTLAEIKEHLVYREANKSQVAAFNVTRTFGDRTKVLLDENAKKFIVTSSSRWQSENPDVMDFSQVTGCQTEIQESKTEIKTKDKDGKSVSYNPPRYDIYYDFDIKIHINSPWFNEISFQLNKDSVEKSNYAKYRELEQQANEIKQALMQARQDARENINTTVVGSNAQKSPQKCPTCSATTTPDENGCCEYCGGVLN